MKRGIKGARKMTLPQLADAMETAGVTDLRGDAVLPYILRAIGKQRDPRVVAALGRAARVGRGRRAAQGRQPRRRVRPLRGRADHGRLVAAAGARRLRARARQGHLRPLHRLQEPRQRAEQPRRPPRVGLPGRHLRPRAEGPAHAARPQAAEEAEGPPGKKARYSRTYCGGTKRRRGTLRRCRACWCPPWSRPSARRRRSSTARTTSARASPASGRPDPRRKAGDQLCFDSIWMRALGAAQQPVIHWINRPTFQQAVEIQGRAPR